MVKTSVSILILLFLSVLSGCSFRAAPNTFLKKDIGQYSVRRLAVLPFHNGTDTKGAGEVVTSTFIEELLDQGDVEVEFPGNVRNLIVGERIVIRKGIGFEQISLIGKRLNVDAVIIGSVTQYEGDDGRGSANPVVSVNARMVHAKTSSILWIGQNQRIGDDYITVFDFGEINSTASLTRRVVSELIETIK